NLQPAQTARRSAQRRLCQCGDDRPLGSGVLFRFHHELLSAFGRVLPRLLFRPPDPGAPEHADTLLPAVSAKARFRPTTQAGSSAPPTDLARRAACALPALWPRSLLPCLLRLVISLITSDLMIDGLGAGSAY